MRKLGIIGGAGPMASALLYETLIQESYVLGRKVPEIFLINYPFTRGLSPEEGSKNRETLYEELSYCITLLANMGVEIGMLACNTLHLFLKQLPHASIHFHYLPELVVQAAMEQKHHKLLILGSQNTCNSQLYQLAGIQTLYPSFEDQLVINAVIDRILEGKILETDSLLVNEVIKRCLQVTAVDGVILGCTDFPVLHHRYPILSEKPLYDSIKIPAKTLVGLL